MGKAWVANMRNGVWHLCKIRKVGRGARYFVWGTFRMRSSIGRISSTLQRKTRSRKYLLHDGDVLFNRTNSPELVGKTAIFSRERQAIFAGYLIRVNHIRTVSDSQYVNLFLNSHVARQYGNSVKTDGVNQSNINARKLSNYPFPYCSIEEQHELVRILEKALSLVDKTEAEINRELQKAAALRQSDPEESLLRSTRCAGSQRRTSLNIARTDQSSKSSAISQRQTPQQAPARQGNGMTGKLPINLDRLLRHRTVEGERIEYKAGWNPKSVLHAICAFANDFHNLGRRLCDIGCQREKRAPGSASERDQLQTYRRDPE